MQNVRKVRLRRGVKNHLPRRSWWPVNKLLRCGVSSHTWLMLFLPTSHLSGNPTGSTFKISHKFILCSPLPLQPPWSIMSSGVSLLSSPLQSILNIGASLMLLESKADYVTSLNTMHQHVPAHAESLQKPWTVPEGPICYAPTSAPSLNLTLIHSLPFSPLQPPSLPATPRTSLTNATGHLLALSSAYNTPPWDVSLAYPATSFKSLLKGHLTKKCLSWPTLVKQHPTFACPLFSLIWY